MCALEITPDRLKKEEPKERPEISGDEGISDAEISPRHKSFQRLFQAAMAATLAAGTFFQEPKVAQAAEVTPQMSWQEGIQAHRKDVYKAGYEVRSAYVRMKDGTSFWMTIGDGPPVRRDPYSNILGSTGISEQENVQQQKRILGESLKANKVEVLCDAHSHPVSVGALGYFPKSAVEQARAQDTSTLLLPPSTRDVGIYGYREFFGGNIRHEEVVFDPSGAWYYQHATRSDLAERPEVLKQYAAYVRTANAFWRFHDSTLMPAIKNLSLSKLEEFVTKLSERDRERPHKSDTRGNAEERRAAREIAVSNAITTHRSPEIAEYFLVDTSAKELYKEWIDVVLEGEIRNFNRLVDAHNTIVKESISGMPSEASFQKLYDAYLINLSKVRFVPYDKLSKEPDCAGVRYGPKDPQ